MKTTAKRPIRRALSVLLSAVMVFTALPLMSINASAATYSDLAEALDRVENFTIRSPASNVDSWDSTSRSPGSSDDISLYQGLSTSGTYTAASGGLGLWDAVKIYAELANGVARTNPTVSAPSNWAPSPGSTNAVAARIPTDFTNSGSVANYTAPLIRNTIMGDSEVAAYAGILGYFDGGFRTNTGGQATGGYELLDTPRTMWYDRVWSNLGVTQTNNPWHGSWLPAPGGFVALLSPMEALENYSDDLDDYDDSHTIATASEVYHYHQTYYSGAWQSASYLAGNATRQRYRYVWHALSAIEYHEGADVVGVPASQSTATLDAKALRAWRDLDWTADMENMSYGELVELRDAYDDACQDMWAAMFAQDIGGTLVPLLNSANADLLEFFGLKDKDDGDNYRDDIIDWMATRLKEDYAQWFHNDTATPAYGMLVSPNPAAVFNTAAMSNFDPRPTIAGRDYDGLVDLLAEGRAKYLALKTVYDTPSESDVWDKLLEKYPAMSSTSLDDEAAWLANLQRVIYLWDLLEMREEVRVFLDEESVVTKLHEGVNPNDIDNNPFDEENENDPNGPFGDSDYTIPNWKLALFIQRVEEYQAILLLMDVDNQDLVDELFRDYNGRDLEAELVARYADLEEEKDYRWGFGYSEDYWYSYRDFFTPLYFGSYLNMSAEDIMAFFKNDTINPTLPGDVAPKPKYAGVEKNWQEYQDLSDACKAAFGGDDSYGSPWWEIYGAYEETVIKKAIDKIFVTLAKELTTRIDQAMKLVFATEAENLITLDNTAYADTRHGVVEALSWGSFTKLKKAIDLLNYGVPGKDLYAFLDEYGKLDLLGFEGPASYEELPFNPPQPVYYDGLVLEDLKFLLEIMAVIQDFLDDPSLYFQQTYLPPASRQPWDSPPPPNPDILPDHWYADVDPANLADFWADPEDYFETLHKPDGNGGTDDPAIKEFINRLDSLLSVGDLSGVGSVVDISSLLDPDTLGIGPDDPLNINTIIDGAMTNLLYNDDTVNALVEMLYPMLLDQLESLIDDSLLPMVEDLMDEPMDVGADLTNGLFTNALVITLNRLKVKHLYDAQVTTQSFGDLKLYPNLLGDALGAGVMVTNTFDYAKQALQDANNGGAGWAHYDTGTGYSGTANSDQEAIYLKEAWTKDASPSLYAYNEDGSFGLPWYIDVYGPDEPNAGEPRTPVEKEKRFRDALAVVFQGMYPLLGALFLNQPQELKNNFMGNIWANIKSPFNLIPSLSGSQVELKLTANGVNGYAQLLTPIFECLLGDDITVIPEITDLSGYTNAGELVDAILDPLYEYIGRLKAKPVTEILRLLPNLCYAFQLERVKPLMDNLEIVLAYDIDVRFWAAIDLILFKVPEFWLSDVMNFVGAGSFLGDTVDPPLDVTELLGGLDLEKILSMDGLMDLALGALGGSLELPPPNPGRIATYGEISSPAWTSKRYDPYATAPYTRHYITANEPDVMQALLKYLFGIGFFTPNGTYDECVAAIAELVLPTGYPVTPPPVTYGTPAVVSTPYPSWWAGRDTPQAEIKAELDGEYLVTNADLVLDLIFDAFAGQTFGQWLSTQLDSMTDAAAFRDLVKSVQDFLGDGIMADVLAILDAFAKYGSVPTLLTAPIMVGGDLVDLADLLRQLLPYDAIDNPDGYNGPAAPVTGVQSFFDALAEYLAPVVTILDVLLFGSDLELIDIGDKTGLFAVKGDNGFVNALVPIIEAFTNPLGLPGPIAPLVSDTSEAKLKALFDPLVAVIDNILTKPVDKLLSLLPNLAFFLCKPQEVGLESPLQQSLDNLLQPLYVLLDTVRPLVDVLAMPALADLVAGLPAGISIDGKLLVDGNALVKSLLADLVAGLPFTPNVNLTSFLQGTLHSSGTWLIADKPAALFALFGNLGVLSLIEDMGMTGVTQLIQYGKFDDPLLIDYGKAPPAAKVAAPPKWLKDAQAQFLTENVDAVIEWAWGQLIAGNPAVKARLEQLLSDLINGTGSTDPDPDPNPNPNPDPEPDPGPKPMPGRDSVAIQGASNILHSLAVLLLTLDNPVRNGERFDVFDMIDTITSLFAEEEPAPAPVNLNPPPTPTPPPPPPPPVDPKPGVDLSGVIKDTLVETVQALFGVDFYVKDNLTKIVDAVLGFKDSIGDDIINIVKKLVYIGNKPFDLDTLFAAFEAYNPATVSIKNGDDFIKVLTDLLLPFVPLLDVFLTGSNILFIKDPRITGTETDPAIQGVTDQGFLRVYGYDGYRTGLLPLLAGLAASFPGVLDKVVDADTFKTATDRNKIGAIIGPIMALLDALASQPTDTLLKLLPNLIYIISDKNGGLLDDVIDGLGFDLRNLIVGTITLLPNGYHVLGVNGNKPDKASYVEVAPAQLLIQLLEELGAFEMIEDSGFAGLVELLNYPGREPDVFKPVDYPSVDPVDYASLYNGWTWTRRDAAAMADKLPGLLDDLLELFLGESLESLFRGLLGDSLFTQENFDNLVGGLQKSLANLDLNIALIPGAKEGDPPLKTLGDLLAGIVKIGDTEVDVIGILDALANWKASGKITGQDSFINELVSFLTPAVPLLDWLLFGEDIIVLADEANINGGDGLLKAFGYEGYKYGLIPIYEALLMPLGAGSKIQPAEAVKAMTGAAKLKALLNPLLYLVDEVVTNPLENLLKLLPNIAYFAGAKNPNGKTPLEESLNNALYAATSLVGLVTGAPVNAGGLLALLGIDIDLGDIGGLLDGLLLDAVGIPDLGSTLLKKLLVGTPVAYDSLSGSRAIYLSVLTPEDRADLLTVLLRTIIELVQGNKETREAVVKMLTNLIIPEGQFGNRALHWGIHFILWAMRLLGTELTLEQFQRMVNFLSWFMPIIKWVMSIFKF